MSAPLDLTPDERAVAPADRRFEAATEPAARPLSALPGELASWWRRVPRRRVGELGEDLAELGHLG